ncbi:MAG: hypothetical protein SGI92_13765 [Bryobacteraceae bacterium]|nr:hypothetical protein [Bryobacteraceae bacterium]
MRYADTAGVSFEQQAYPTRGYLLGGVTHRSAGTSGVDTLSSAADRGKIVKFPLSIDSASPPIP